MTEQNRRYVTKEIGKLLSEIWRVKGLAEQEDGPQHPMTKKLASMHEEAQKLLRWDSPPTYLYIQGLIPSGLGLQQQLCIPPELRPRYLISVLRLRI